MAFERFDGEQGQSGTPGPFEAEAAALATDIVESMNNIAARGTSQEKSEAIRIMAVTFLVTAIEAGKLRDRLDGSSK